MNRSLLFSLMVAAAFAQAAVASVFSLNYYGETADGSSQGGIPIPLGTAFEVHALFDSVPVEVPEGGVALYLPTDISLVHGGVTSTAIFDPGAFFILMADPSNPEFTGVYLPVLGGDSNGAFAPAYLTAIPPVLAATLTPTEFSSYLGSLSSSLSINTDRGALELTFAQDAGGVHATITAIPEPAACAAAAGVALLGFAVWRRRHQG